MKNDALYFKVYREILNDIKSGVFHRGQMLPSERTLCSKYSVSRHTLRMSLNLLNKADVISTRPGAGSFVQPTLFTQPLTRFYSFSNALKEADITITNHIVSYAMCPADEKLSRKIGCPVGSAVHKLVRLRSAKEEPLMLETTYLPVKRFAFLDIERLENGSLYEFLTSTYGFAIENARETLRPVMPSSQEKELMKIADLLPCISLERFTYENGLCVEYTKSTVRGDKYIFSVNLI